MDERTVSRTKAAGRWASAVAVCVLVAPAGAGAANHPVNATGNQQHFSPAEITVPVGGLGHVETTSAEAQRCVRDEWRGT